VVHVTSYVKEGNMYFKVEKVVISMTSDYKPVYSSEVKKTRISKLEYRRATRFLDDREALVYGELV
jgi:hypothetical protein